MIQIRNILTALIMLIATLGVTGAANAQNINCWGFACGDGSSQAWGSNQWNGGQQWVNPGWNPNSQWVNPGINPVVIPPVVGGGYNYNRVDIRTSGCQQNLGSAIACMVAGTATQTIGQMLVNRSAVREQVAGQQRLAQTFRPTGQATRQPIGFCLGAAGRQIEVYAGDDVGRICQ